MKRKLGYVCTWIGLIFIAGAVILLLYNMWDNNRAKDSCERVLLEYDTYADEMGIQLEGTNELLHEMIPEMEMPTVTVDGVTYIGKLTLVSLDMTLPVSSEWSADLLKITPCRYKGSAYTDDLIIAGHNYKSHFSGIKKLKPGDHIEFIDVDNNVFTYEVMDLETIRGTDIEAMEMGEWDLTLFTCTSDSKSRVTVRCERIGSDL